MPAHSDGKRAPQGGSLGVHVGSRVEVVVESLASGGEGVARLDGRVMFVARSAPGDRALVEITELARHHGRASVVEIRSPGPDRRTPPCRHAATCGGCAWQHVTPEGQRAAKARIVAEALSRIAGIRLDAPVEVLHGDELHYRTRADLATTRSSKGRYQLGYRRGSSRVVEPVEECPVLVAPLEAEFQRLRALPESIPAGAVMVRLAHGEEGPRALFVDAEDMLMAPRAAESAASRTPPVLPDAPAGDAHRAGSSRAKSSPTRSSRAASTRAELARAESAGAESLRADSTRAGSLPAEPRAGADDDLLRVHQTIGGLRYAFDLLGFWQGNHQLVGELVRRAVGDEKGNEALDLYCGSGLFTLPLAARFERVVGIESDERSIVRARESAEKNGVERTIFVTSEVERYLRKLSDGAAPDLVLLDPPRRGAGPEVMQHLVRIAPKRVRYVSCDPATLARDLKDLVAGGYELRSIVALDLFPQTPHVECVAVLTRGDSTPSA